MTIHLDRICTYIYGKIVYTRIIRRIYPHTVIQIRKQRKISLTSVCIHIRFWPTLHIYGSGQPYARALIRHPPTLLLRTSVLLYHVSAVSLTCVHACRSKGWSIRCGDINKCILNRTPDTCLCVFGGGVGGVWGGRIGMWVWVCFLREVGRFE